ncbi:hypothetical protein [Nostoc sp. MG11]|uniref:hypothetical protein n=1 Tax=Nostoc sp. MG11 TaxID=2721166 RepID=UPI001867C112|nr:hypothetical protein [Nostoc sp. MG11]
MNLQVAMAKTLTGKALSSQTMPKYLEMLSSMRVDAIKSIFKRWASDLRWQTVLELEALAVNELRSLEQVEPEFYALLSEEVLPM